MSNNNISLISNTTEPIIYNTKDIERIMGFGKNKANSLMNSKFFPSTKIGGKWIVTKILFEEWLLKNAYKQVTI